MKIKRNFFLFTRSLAATCLLLVITSCQQSWKFEKAEKVQAVVVERWTHGAMIFSLHKMLRVKFKDVESDVESPDLYFKHKKGEEVELLLITEINEQTGERRQRFELPKVVQTTHR